MSRQHDLYGLRLEAELSGVRALDAVDDELWWSPPTPFVGMHAVIALAAAGDATGLRLMGRRASLDDRPVFREVIAPLAVAMSLLVRRRYDEAADVLADVVPQAHRLGGSEAQRDVIEESFIYALTCAGRFQPAQELLRHRSDGPARPVFVPDEARQTG